MEPKKNPKYDVHRYRSTIFQISLAITLMLMITAFQWTTKVKKNPNPKPEPPISYNPYEDYIPEIRSKNDDAPKPEKIKPPKPIVPEFVPVEDEQENDNAPAIDQGKEIDASTPIGNYEIPIEKVKDSIFFIVEKMPEPIGGYERFYNTLSKNIKYPRRAKSEQIIGKVFVSFVVNEKSELSDFKVVKGIGSGCDEEAIRVIGLTKWEAGKQRGQPVKVRMMQTINFKIN